MKLTFDSIAIFDAKTDAVKFAGRYIDRMGLERFAICRVARGFLIARCNLAEASPERLLDAYVSVRDEVNAIAAQQFAAGEQRPFIDLGHHVCRAQLLGQGKGE